MAKRQISSAIQKATKCAPASTEKDAKVKDAHKFARNLDSRLRAGDFENSVTFTHRDGSVVCFQSAFALRWKQYTMIFTEHRKYHLHATEDLLRERAYERSDPRHRSDWSLKVKELNKLHKLARSLGLFIVLGSKIRFAQYVTAAMSLMKSKSRVVCAISLNCRREIQKMVGRIWRTNSVITSSHRKVEDAGRLRNSWRFLWRQTQMGRRRS